MAIYEATIDIPDLPPPPSGGGAPQLGRNVWMNGNMDIWQKGPAMAAPAAIGGYQCDFFGHRGVGSTVFVERKNFPLGQTEVPGNPRHYTRVTVNSSPGANSYALMASDIDDVTLFNGSKSTQTIWIRSNAARNICVEWNQHFGDGGGSAEWFGTPKTLALTTAWQRFDIEYEWPSVTGKTIGSSATDTDRLGVVFWLDAGSSFNARTNSLGQQSCVVEFARTCMVHDPDGIVPSIEDPYALVDIGPEAELARCQSLMEVFTITELVWSGYVASGGYRWLGVPFKTTKRRLPVVWVTQGPSSGFGAVSCAQVSLQGMQLLAVGNATINNAYFQASVIVDANHPYTP